MQNTEFFVKPSAATALSKVSVSSDPLSMIDFGRSCGVLVLDDDEFCLSEYAEAVSSNGYDCRTASNAVEALREIDNDPTIGIIITDLSMPSMDGITFLEEVDARFALFRPIVPIVITGIGTLDAAIRAMNANAVDFLAKPVAPLELAQALRRASRRRSQMASRLHMAAMMQAGPQDNAASDSDGQSEDQFSHEGLIKIVRRVIRFRQQRADFLGQELFADPSWDILLDLTLAKLQRVPVPVSSACLAAQVPFTTAFRYVGDLVNQGMVRRWKDPRDQRRVLLELEDSAFEAMTNFLRAAFAK